MSSPPPTRVLMAAEQLRRTVPGGIGTYARGLLQGLAELAADGNEPAVDLVLSASRPPPRREGGGAEPLARFGWPVRTSPLPGRLLTRAWDRGLVGAPGGYDVVHAVSLAAPPVRGGGGTGARAAKVVTVHDLAWRRFPEATTGRGRRWQEGALQRALRSADAMVVPSAAVAADLTAAGGGREAVVIVPGGADHLPPPDRAAAAAALAARGVDGPYLLTVSTLEPRKNMERLVAAFGAARRSLPEPWPLVVVGPAGWGRSPVSGPAEGGRLPEGVVALGAVSEGALAGLYAGARAFAYVPLTEGYGLPPLEAMRFGVPVVASTGVPSVEAQGGDPTADAGPAVPGGPAALRVDPFDVGAIAAALVATATDDRVRRPLVACGRALAGRRTWRRVARQHVALWTSLR